MKTPKHHHRFHDEDPNQSFACHITRAALKSDLPASAEELMMQPMREHEATLSVTMDDGTVQEFQAYRIVHSDILGPGKGGIRFASGVDRDEVVALASRMSLKCSLMGLPLGGAKGGVDVDPSKLSKSEKERVARAYMQAFSDILGPNTDIPAPDVGTNAQVMDWMADEYGKIKGAYEPAVVTGKSMEAGGSEGRNMATGRGVTTAVLAALRYKRMHPDRSTAIIQGFGNVGSVTAQLLSEAGVRITGISDISGAYYNPNGINIGAALEYVRNYNSLKGFTGVDMLSNDMILLMPCDILVPAAIENQITHANAYDIKAAIIVEGANGPVSVMADDILEEKGVLVVPDILANAGGVTVSYFEWLQNKNRSRWTLEQVEVTADYIMQIALENTFAAAYEYKTTLRTAAYILAMNRIYTAINKQAA